MKHRNALVLATSYRDVPRATALEFFHEGLSIYILGGPGAKIANIKRNPNVSAFIYEQPMDHSVSQACLQLFGRAELITLRGNPRLYRAKMRKWNLYAVMAALLGPLARQRGLAGEEAEAFIKKNTEACSIIKITPHHIIFKEYPPDFTMRKYEWHRRYRKEGNHV